MKIPLRATARDWWRSTHNPPQVPPAHRRELRVVGSVALWLSLLVLTAGVLGVVNGGTKTVAVGFLLIAVATMLLPTSWMVYRTGRKDKESR